MLQNILPENCTNWRKGGRCYGQWRYGGDCSALCKAGKCPREVKPDTNAKALLVEAVNEIKILNRFIWGPGLKHGNHDLIKRIEEATK